MSSEIQVTRRKTTAERSTARNGAGSPKHVANQKHPRRLSHGKDVPSARNSLDRGCSPQPPQRSLRAPPGATSMVTPRRRLSMNKLREGSPVPQAQKAKNSQNNLGTDDLRKYRSRSNDCSPPKSSQKNRNIESPQASPNNHAYREVVVGSAKDSSPKRVPGGTRVSPKPNHGSKQHLRKDGKNPTSPQSPMRVERKEDDDEIYDIGPSWRFRSPATQEVRRKSVQKSSPAAYKAEEIRRILSECDKLKAEAGDTLKNGVEQIELNVALKDKFSFVSEVAFELMEKMADVSGSDDLKRFAMQAKKAQQRKAEQGHSEPLERKSEDGMDKNFISKPTPQVRNPRLPLRHRDSVIASETKCEAESANPAPKFDSSRFVQEVLMMAASGCGSPGQKASMASPKTPSSKRGFSPVASSCFSAVSSLGSARSVTSTAASCSDVLGKTHRLDASSQKSVVPNDLLAVPPCPSPRVIQSSTLSPRVVQAAEIRKPSKITNVERPAPEDASTQKRCLSLQSPSCPPQYAFQQAAPQCIEIAESPKPTTGAFGSPKSPSNLGSPNARSHLVMNLSGSFVVPRITMGSSSVAAPQTMNAGVATASQITSGSFSVPSKPLSSTLCETSQGVGCWSEILRHQQHAPGLIVDELELQSLEASCPSLKRALVAKLGLLGDVTIQRMSTHGGLNMGIYIAQDASSTLILKFATSTRYMGLPTEAELLLSLSKKVPAILSDSDLAFPIGIFLLTACGQRRNLIVMKKVRGQALADAISEKLHSGQSQDIKSLLHEFGRFLSRFHKRYGMQHGDCQQGNIFYDETSRRFSLIDLADMGSPLVKTLDVDYFCTALQGLMRKHPQHLCEECSLAFKTGYSA